ncbi:MAG: magnesium transporter CorA family protein [Patescibacteria group bacterium]|jgi:magnesium transporter
MANKILTTDKTGVKDASLNDFKVGKYVWADFTGPTSAELIMLRQTVGMSENELAELTRPSQRAMLYRIGKFIIVIFTSIVSRGDIFETQPLVMLISESGKSLITLHREPCTAASKVAAYAPEDLKRILRAGIPELVVNLCAEATDEFFGAADALSDKIEDIEKRMFDYKHSNAVMRDTLAVKKSLIYAHKGLVANREVTYVVQKEFGGHLSGTATEQLRDISMDTTQLSEMVTTYRDILTSAIEIHLTAISNNLNVIMKKVTSWGALILVPSLIAGIFGMNFQHIPTLDSPAGFYVSLIVMVISVSALAVYFRKRDWL